MSRSTRENLYRLQAHALIDGAGKCVGRDPGPLPFDGELAKLPCPICLKPYALGDLREDHAPPKAGQSRLGDPRVVVLTCDTCNRGAGMTYEGVANSEDSMLFVRPSPFCPVHSRYATSGGLVVPRDLEARTATDLKAAFLIATATFGYRWAASPRLASVRKVLRGELLSSLATDDFDLVCDHSGSVPAFQVMTITAPIKAVAISGAHVVVVLPCDSSPRKISGAIQTELDPVTRMIRATVGFRLPWPRDFTRSVQVRQVWDDLHTANLFHFDRCQAEEHHRGFGVESTDLAMMFGF